MKSPAPQLPLTPAQLSSWGTSLLSDKDGSQCPLLILLWQGKPGVTVFPMPLGWNAWLLSKSFQSCSADLFLVVWLKTAGFCGVFLSVFLSDVSGLLASLVPSLGYTGIKKTQETQLCIFWTYVIKPYKFRSILAFQCIEHFNIIW